MKLAAIFEVVGLTAEQIRAVTKGVTVQRVEPPPGQDERPRPNCPYCGRRVGRCQQIRATGLSLFL